MTDEAKAKLRASSLGRRHTDESRAKMSAMHTGKAISEEMAYKLLAANLGVRHSGIRRAKNAAAQQAKPPAGRFKGVSFCKSLGKWRAQITISRRQRYLGLFSQEEDAARAYDAAALDAWGAGNCYLNFPDREVEANALDWKRAS